MFVYSKGSKKYYNVNAFDEFWIEERVNSDGEEEAVIKGMLRGEEREINTYDDYEDAELALEDDMLDIN